MNQSLLRVQTSTTQIRNISDKTHGREKIYSLLSETFSISLFLIEQHRLGSALKQNVILYIFKNSVQTTFSLEKLHDL